MEIDRKINSSILRSVLNVELNGISFNGIGDIHSSHNSNLLTYIKDIKFAPIISSNNSISGVICTRAISATLPERLIKIIVDDPNYAFFKLVDYFGSKLLYENTILSPISESVTIAQTGVKIGNNVIIEPNVTILSGVIIADNVIIRAGSVLGLDTFQHQRTSHGIISPKHDGLLVISNGVEIGANSTISKGFSYRNTYIGVNSKLDAQVYIGHGAQVEDEVFICAGVRLMGHTKVGSFSFIGPSATVCSRVTIGSKSKVSLGSVVTKNVNDGSTVTGNFAIPHEDFIKMIKASISLV